MSGMGMASIWSVQFRSVSIRGCPPSIGSSSSSRTTTHRIRNGISISKMVTRTPQHSFNSIAKLVASVPVPPFLLNRNAGSNFSIWVCVVVLVLVAVVRAFSRKRERPGSVADLVRRGQLRSDRRGISRPLKYEDLFNNPLVKVSKNKSTVEMCGKVYRLAPVTLTREKQAIHQRKRSRAY